MEVVDAPEGIRVRRLAAADVDAVVRIETDAFSSPWRRDTFLDLLDRPGLEFLVLEDVQAGIVGYGVLWCILDQGELANMAVTPDHRRRGLGSYLLRRILETARKRGVKTIFLEVRASNEIAARLYARFGFTEVGVRPGYYTDPPEDARILRVVLD